MRSYLGSLVQSAAQVAQPSLQLRPESSDNTGADPSQQAELTPSAMPALSAPVLPSLGCWGHPVACRRPCIHFISGHCQSGQACPYCHIPHTEKMAKLDKRQRMMLQQLGRPKVASMVLHFCSIKAEQGGFSDLAADILGLLKQESQGATCPEMSTDRDLKNIRRTLTRMNFSSLVGLVTHLSPNQALQAEDAPQCGLSLVDALEALRMQLPVEVFAQ